MILLVAALAFALAPSQADAARGDRRAFSGKGMWIWQLEKSSGGRPAAISRLARRNGVRTVFVKSSDGGRNYWRQFSRTLVRTLSRRGLRVCAWQYVYGRDPVGEARLAARAVRAGADCLVVDAETEYEGRYGPAVTYIRALRNRIGNRYPVGLTGFPYVDLHPAFPYSVFLGPGGAQFNLPQMYWKTIGTSTTAVFRRTFRTNRPYGRPIAPLGQLYQDPPLAQIRRFRSLARSYGAPGMSWWVWQEASRREWGAVGGRTGRAAGAGGRPARGLVGLRKGSQGDLVVWAQEHLAAAGRRLRIDGGFGARTQRAVRRFQRLKGLRATGVIDTRTWRALLRYTPVRVRWDRKARGGSRAANGERRTGPPSAWLRARRNELNPVGARAPRRDAGASR